MSNSAPSRNRGPRHGIFPGRWEQQLKVDGYDCSEPRAPEGAPLQNNHLVFWGTMEDLIFPRRGSQFRVATRPLGGMAIDSTLSVQFDDLSISPRLREGFLESAKNAVAAIEELCYLEMVYPERFPRRT